MVTALAHLQADPLDDLLHKTVSDTTSQLEGLEVRKTAGIQLRSRMKWHKVGDATSKEFYRLAKEQMSAAHIIALEDEQGLVYSEQKTMESICQK